MKPIGQVQGKPVILTGLRANNDLQVGNYLGAIRPMVEMATKHAGEYEVNIFVPDLHSFTTPIDHSALNKQVMRNLKLFVAAGMPLDNRDVHIYRQSFVPAHSELTWILACFSGFGELGRMTEFKDKSQRLGSDHIGVGQFIYPILQAADILLYGASYIPVGEDQRQHIEFTRDIAGRMNSKFGDLFMLPKPIKEQLAFVGATKPLRIMDLQDPTKKMSKSDEIGKGVVFLGDTPEAAAAKIMAATTDSLGNIQNDSTNQPGIANLLQLLALMTNHKLESVTQEYVGQKQYGPLKQALVASVKVFLQDFQAKLATVDEQAILTKLETSEKLMNQTANKTLLRVQQAVGLRPN